MKWINASLWLLPLAVLSGCGMESTSLTQATGNNGSAVVYDVFNGKKVAVEWIDGREFIYGTDMMIPSRPDTSRAAARTQGVYLGNSNYPWPDSVIPCAFDVSHYDSISITAAIDSWNDSLRQYAANVRFKYVPTNYSGAKLTIQTGKCSGGDLVACATLGSKGNGGTIIYDYSFGIGAIAHELGHVLGLAHEQNHPRIRDYVYVDGTPKDTSSCSDPISRWQTDYEASYYSDVPNSKSIMLYQGTNFGKGFFDAKYTGDCDGALIKWKSNHELVTPGSHISSGDVAAVKNLYLAQKTSAGISKWPDGKMISVSIRAGAGVDSTKLDMTSLRSAVVEAAARWISNIDPTQNAISVNVTKTVGDVDIELVDATNHVDKFSYDCNPSSSRNTCYVAIPAYNLGRDPAANPENMMNIIYRSNVLQAMMGNVLADVVENVGSATYLYQDFTKKEILPSDAEVSQIRATYGSSANFAPLIERQATNGVTSKWNRSEITYPNLFTDWNSASVERSTPAHYKVLARVPLSGKYPDTYRMRIFELDALKNAGGPYQSVVSGYAYWSDVSANFGSNMLGTCVQDAIPSSVSEKSPTNVSLFKNSSFISGKMVPIVSINNGSASGDPNTAWYVWTGGGGDCRAVIGYGVRPY